jgi:predicted alpha/beta superfamily hydrolase
MSHLKHTRLAVAFVLSGFTHTVHGADKASLLVVGESFAIQSKILSESRRVNVYLPPAYGSSSNTRLPALYLLDGGLAEDFLHIAGLVQVSTSNGTMRPFIVVGVENTLRRRDMTGPTNNVEDKKIAPKVGGSEAFRSFLRRELMPQVDARYRTTKKRAIVGESLAGLFVVETFLLEPDLFETYIAVDPSLWWNDQALVKDAKRRLHEHTSLSKTLYIATSGEGGIDGAVAGFTESLSQDAPTGLKWRHDKLTSERHSTVFHPAAMNAFREVFKPDPVKKQ